MTVVVFERHALLNALALVGKVQPWQRAEPRYEADTGKPLTPRMIPGVVRVHVSGGRARITCANFDHQISTVVACDGQDGTLFLPLVAFSAAVGKAPHGAQVELQAAGPSVLVRFGRTRITTVATEQDFPPITAGEYASAATLPADVLRRGIGQVAAAAQEDAKQPWRSGVYLHDGPAGPAFTAMDSFRIHAARAEGDAVGAKAIIPRAAAKLLSGLLPEEGNVTIAQDDRSACFGWADTLFRTKLIDAQYPRVEDQLSRDGGNALRANAAALVGDLELVACVADAKLQEIRFTLGSTCEVSASRNGLNGRDTGQIALDAGYSGAPMAISFQLRLVTDALQHFGEREVVWRMGGPFEPTVISCPTLPGLEMMVAPVLPASTAQKVAA